MTDHEETAKPVYAYASRNVNLSDRERFAVADASGYWLVLEGDWGGQIYLTVPLALVGPNARIFDLLQEIDKREWGCNEEDGASALVYSPEATLDRMRAYGADEDFIKEMRSDMGHYSGGCGGGELTDGLWLGCGIDPDHVRAMLDLQKPTPSKVGSR